MQLANIAGFGVLWILKYLFLDKIMFGAEHHTPYDEDIEVEEALAETGETGAVVIRHPKPVLSLIRHPSRASREVPGLAGASDGAPPGGGAAPRCCGAISDQ